MRGVGVVLLSVAALAVPAPAAATTWDFRTPGDAAYCRLEFAPVRGGGSVFNAFRCMTPSNGFWIRLSGFEVSGLGRATESVRVTKGYDVRFLAYRNQRVHLLRFGDEFASSDAYAVTCRSRRDGLVCKHYDGLAFWLGRFRGYRISYEKPGFRPHVRPLLRAHGVWCGIDLDVLEPSAPLLKCWRPADGAILYVGHGSGYRGSYVRSEQAIDFRPRGFAVLGTGRTATWRCRKVEPSFAERCSTGVGETVFSCRSTTVRLICRNRAGHGFWVSRAAFYAF
jgi:hypothetical protein